MDTRERMNKIAKIINELFPNEGFALIVFPFYNPGISNYISNANRKDIIKGLREAAKRFENKEDFKSISPMGDDNN